MSYSPPVNLAERIDALVSKQVAADGPGVAVAVFADGQILHTRGFGLANVEWGMPIGADTLFRIGSLTKQFTATAVMMLKESGALELHDALAKHLPEFSSPARAATLLQLLQHTSGIKSYTNDAACVADFRSDIRLARLVERIGQLPMEFAPGSRYHYNNSGYVLLGAVIERCSGMRYREFISERICKPLGMQNTGVVFDSEVRPRRAAGYQLGRNGGVENATYLSMSWLHAAGGLSSTINDLVRWDTAVRRNELVSAESFAHMLQPTQLNDGTTYPYGLGWGTGAYCGHEIFHHSGGVNGFVCQMRHVVEPEVTVLLLSNSMATPFDSMTRAILRIALQLPSAERISFSPDAQRLQACIGRYKNADGVAVELRANEQGLTLATPGGLVQALLATSEDRFCIAQDREYTWQFSALDAGKFGRIESTVPMFPPETFWRIDADQLCVA